jgi:DNA-binding CsgD family transcriptional regulator
MKNRNAVKTTLVELQQEWNLLLIAKSYFVSAVMETEKGDLISALRTARVASDRSLLLLDQHLKRLVLHLPAVDNQLAINPIRMDDPDNLKSLHRLYHPKDHLINLETDILFFNMLHSLPEHEGKRLQMHCLRRIQNKQGGYDVYLVRMVVLKYDMAGNPWLVKIELERMTQFMPKEFYHQRTAVLITSDAKDKVALLDVQNPNALTTDELNVLKQAACKKSVKETAAALNKKADTVKKIRARIMLKLNAPTMELACLMAKMLKIV